MKLFSVIQKNFKIFIRSKVSALIIFLGPLLLVSLIGMSFSNSQLPGLTVGTYSSSYNDFTNSIIKKIEDNKFTIHKYDNTDACSNAVKKGDTGICLLFPANMDTTNNEVTFVVDYSKINLVFIVLDVINNRVSERATELRQNYATELLTKVVQTRTDLQTQKTNAETLSSKQTEAQDTAKRAASNVNEINPNTDFGSKFSISDAQSSISSITGRIDDAKSTIKDTKTKVSGSSLSDTEKGVINDDLDTANGKLSGALLYLQGNESISSLEGMLVDLGNSLENAKLQLESIKKKRDAVKGDITTLQGSITESINKVSDLSSSITTMISRIENVQESDSAQLVSPIRTKIEPVTTPETHFNYLFPTLIVLIVMITAILLSSTLVMNEKKSRSFFRNFITPTSDIVFDAGTFLTAFLVILIQLVIFLVISSFFFETKVAASLGSASLLLVLISSAFILLGMIIGYVFKSEETYVLASITVSALLLFLSSTVMPIESISNSIRQFASFTPFVVSEHALRQVMFFNFSLSSMTQEFAILLGYIVVFAGIIFAVEKLLRHKISFKRKEVKK